MKKNLITQKVQFKYAQPEPFVFIPAGHGLPGLVAVPIKEIYEHRSDANSKPTGDAGSGS